MVRLLVVDDDKDQVALFTQMLARTEHTVIGANSAVDALGILRRDPAIDVVLTDFRMPAVDGSALLDRMRSDYPHIPVIVMSVDRGTHSVEELVQRGAASYLRKPFNRQELLDTIRDVMARPQSKRAAVRHLLESEETETAQMLLESMPADPASEEWADWLRSVAELEAHAREQLDQIGIEVERAYRRGFTEALSTMLKYYEAAGEVTLRDLQRFVWTHDLWQRELGPTKLKLDDNSHPTTVFPPLYREVVRLRKFPRKTY